MFKDREKLYQIYHTILSMALTWALTLIINQYFNLKVPIVLSAFFSLALAALIYLFDCNRKNTVSYLILASLIPILGLIFWIMKVNPLTWIKKLLHWCATYNGTEELYKTGYACFVVFGIVLLSSVIFYLLMKQPLVKIILSVIIFVMMIILGVSEVGISKVVVCVSIFYILTILLEICGYLYSKKAGKQEKKAGILYLAPVCLLLAVLSISLPSKPEPIEWKGVKHLYSSIKEQLDIWMTELDYYRENRSGEFAVTFTGYSDDGGGLSNNGLTQDSKVAMKVTCNKGNAPIYLIGSVSDVYTGFSWEKSRTDFIPEEQEYLLDYTELFYAMSRQNIQVLENEQLVERRTLKIDFNNIKTKTLFYPTKSSWFETLGKKKLPTMETANITFPHAQGEGTSYQNVYFEMNLQGDAFQNIIRETGTFSYDNVNSINVDTVKWLDKNLLYQDNAHPVLKKWNFYELLRDRAEMIKNQYTALPEKLPGRVKELTEQVTADYDNPYDKLKAIEKFLQAYSYNIQPKKIPKNKDFVDTFLFENKEGYCTSYATAMAIMGRCIGIPTRYVEGFVVNYDEKEKNNTYLVRNNQAHAWAEAYIEGFGWIPFEATPPYYNVRYVAWREKTKHQDSGYTDYSDQYNQQRIENMMGLGEGAKNLDTKAKDNGASEVFIGFIILLSAIFVLLLFFIGYYLVLRYKYKRAFDKADYSRKMYLDFLRILWLLKREGFVLGQQETILMLARRVKDRFHYNKIIFPDVANIFMRYRYAQEAITKKEFMQVEKYYVGLKNKQREEESRLKVLLGEFIFLTKKSNR